MIVRQFEPSKLVGEGRVFHFPATGFPIYEHAHVRERLTFDDQTGRDRLFLTDIFQDSDHLRDCTGDGVH